MENVERYSFFTLYRSEYVKSNSVSKGSMNIPGFLVIILQ